MLVETDWLHWIIWITPFAAGAIYLANRILHQWGTPLFITFMAFILLVIYSIVAIYLRKQEAWDWFDTALATIFSVLAAFTTGIRLFQHQQQTTKNERIEQLDPLLRKEIGQIVISLNSEDGLSLEINGQDWMVNTIQLRPVALAEAIRSGFHDPESTATMIKLMGVLQTHNWETATLYQVVSMGPLEGNRLTVTRRILANMEVEKGKLLKLTDELMKRLDGHPPSESSVK